MGASLEHVCHSARIQTDTAPHRRLLTHQDSARSECTPERTNASTRPRTNLPSDEPDARVGLRVLVVVEVVGKVGGAQRQPREARLRRRD